MKVALLVLNQSVLLLAMQKPVVSGWNRPTAEYYDVPSARVGKAPPRFCFFGICGVAAALIGWQGYTLSLTHDSLKTCRADVALRGKQLFAKCAACLQEPTQQLAPENACCVRCTRSVNDLSGCTCATQTLSITANPLLVLFGVVKTFVVWA